ncbi:hypothetical protein ACLKA7_009716 [Drosophila subpalustris]
MRDQSTIDGNNFGARAFIARRASLPTLSAKMIPEWAPIGSEWRFVEPKPKKQATSKNTCDLRCNRMAGTEPGAASACVFVFGHRANL